MVIWRALNSYRASCSSYEARRRLSALLARSPLKLVHVSANSWMVLLSIANHPNPEHYGKSKNCSDDCVSFHGIDSVDSFAISIT